MIARRQLLTGLASLLAAPSIVRASSLMPVKAWHDGLVIRSYEHWWMGHDGFYNLEMRFGPYREIRCANILNVTQDTAAPASAYVEQLAPR